MGGGREREFCPQKSWLTIFFFFIHDLSQVIDYIQHLQDKVHKYESPYPVWNPDNAKSAPWVYPDLISLLSYDLAVRMTDYAHAGPGH